MFVLGPILLEIIFVLLKPQELMPWLQELKPLYVLPGLIVLGFLYQAFQAGRLGLEPRWIEAPFLRVALGLLAWITLTLLVAAPGETIGAEVVQFGTSLLLCLALAHSVRTLRQFEIVAGVVLALVLFLSVLADHQGLSPKGCYLVDEDTAGLRTFDGRSCEIAKECSRPDFPDEHYHCEHVGLLGTSSINGRVRFLGNLEDPNELALTTSVALPFAFAFFQRKRSALRLLLLLATLGLVGTCMVLSQSRGGQLVFLVVLGTYFVRRFGVWRGVLVGAIVAVPALLLGGRSSGEADSSSLERIECWQTGVDLLRDFPLAGVGKGQFGHHHYLTAHNSYVLAGAELGWPGLAIWSAVMYLAIKVPLSALRALEGRAGVEAEAGRTWSTAMVASMAGMLVGIFFLSFSYHPVLWIYVGLSGALAAAIGPQVPEWRVALSAKEMAALVAGDVVLMVVILAYTRYRLD